MVLAIVALLLTIAAPRYWGSVSRAQEDVLKENIHILREAIDRHYADRQRYPDTLEQLVDRRYLRAVPLDPVTDSANTWTTLPPADPAMGAVFDIRSGAPGSGRNGIPYATW